MAYHPQTNRQVERFNRMLKAMIAKFVNGRQDNWNIYLLAFLYAYRTTPHKSTGHTPYKVMLDRAPPSEDRATELILMDKWVPESFRREEKKWRGKEKRKDFKMLKHVSETFHHFQELHVAQEEARKLILANIESEQQDQVESMPHRSRTWEAGNQVMLRADCKGKGWSKKLSKKWTGPYSIIEVRSPQVVVLEEPNSRNWFIINIKRIKPFNAATWTTLNSSLNEGHYKVEEVLEESITDTGRCV